jgi:uncharacterized protein (DUF111 family)
VEIRESIEQSDLSDFVKKHAVSIFHRVALAEAKIHGTPVEKVGFHEVGALDSIADIVCACVGIEELGVERICASALAMNSSRRRARRSSPSSRCNSG